MIPIYRAKKIVSDEWIEGNHTTSNGLHFIQIDPFCSEQIDPSTLAINFENMIDKNGKKIFASLGEDGIGADEVMGMCRDCNGDELQGLHAPVAFKGMVRFYSETSMSVVIETSDKIAIGTEDWTDPIKLEAGSALRWSDCRHNITAIGIYNGETDERD